MPKKKRKVTLREKIARGMEPVKAKYAAKNPSIETTPEPVPHWKQKIKDKYQNDRE